MIRNSKTDFGVNNSFQEFNDEGSELNKSIKVFNYNKVPLFQSIEELPPLRIITAMTIINTNSGWPPMKSIGIIVIAKTFET